MASNYPLLWKEIEKIKQFTRILNTSRKNLTNFRSKINNQVPIEELTKGTIKDPINIKYEKDESSSYKNNSPTRKRLKKNYTYSRSTFKKKSIDAFKLEPIQNALTKWEASNNMEISKEADEALENIKMQNPEILGWHNYKLINRLSEHWIDRKKIEETITDEAIKRVKATDLEERESNAPQKYEIKDEYIGNSEEQVDILDNQSTPDTQVNALRVLPSTTDFSVLTSVFDQKAGKWRESSRVTHPFISVEVTKIDPYNRNKSSSPTTTQCLMADSGAQCSLLNFKTVRKMQIDPEKLEKSDVSITGVNGKALQSQT